MPVSGSVAPNTISKYELVTAYNACFGTSFDAGTQPSYQLTFASGNEDATGNDPSALEIKRGEAVTLPDCPYELEHMTFDGWNIGGTTYPAGAEYVPDAYDDAVAEGTWSVTVVATATTFDDYLYSYIQEAGIPMVLLADGTVEVDHYKGPFCGPDHRACVVYHLVERYGEGCFVTGHNVCRGVSYEYHVDTCGIDDFRHRVVVRRQHGYFCAALLHLGETERRNGSYRTFNRHFLSF